jgi:beta-N-acetylhexosaminidase
MPVRARRRQALLAACLGASLAAAGLTVVVTAGGHALERSAAAGTHSSLEAALSPAQLAGQRMIYSYDGLTPPASLLSLIRAGKAAGVIFFSSNIAGAAQLQGVIAKLQRANASSPVRAPLLMMTDQEGGLVRRLPGAPALSEKQIGAASNASALAGAAGAGAAANLRSAGINVNLAPVLDVYRRAGNFIDRYQRSYSSSPSKVATLGAAFIAAQQRTGVAATAKHFPGLGAATLSQNTDTGPVTLALRRSQLRSIDELPYRSAIAAGVKLVMVSWAVYPALDPRLPAGLSSAVIHGELRGRLGFRGVTITDALGAGAIARYGSFGQRAVMAAHAGADLLLCATATPGAGTLTSCASALGGLTSALAAGRLQRNYAEQAVARVVALRSSL